MQLRKVLVSRWLLLPVAACLLLVGLRQLDTYRHNAAFSDRFPCLTGRYVPYRDRENAAEDYTNAYDRRVPLHEDWANNFSTLGGMISLDENLLPGLDPVLVTLSHPLRFYEKTWWGYRLAVRYPAGTTVDLGPRNLIGWAVLTSYPTYTRGWRNMYRIPTADETELYNDWDREAWSESMAYTDSMRYYVRTSDLEPLLLQFLEADPEFWHNDLAFPYVNVRSLIPYTEDLGLFRSEYAALSTQDLTDAQLRNFLLFQRDIALWIYGAYRSPDMLDSYFQPPDIALLCIGGLLLAAHLAARWLARPNRRKGALRKVFASRWLLLPVAACLLLAGLRQLDTYRHNAAFSDRFPCLTGLYIPRSERPSVSKGLKPNAYDRRIPLHENWTANFSPLRSFPASLAGISPDSDRILVTLSQPLGFYEKTWWGYRLAVWYPAGTTVDLGPRSLTGWIVLSSYPTYSRGWRSMYRLPTAEETELYNDWDREAYPSPEAYTDSMRYYVRTSELEPLLLQLLETDPAFWRSDLAFPYADMRAIVPYMEDLGIYKSAYLTLSMEDLTDEQIRNLLLYRMDLAFWIYGRYRSPDLLDSYVQPPDIALPVAACLLLAAHLAARRLARPNRRKAALQIILACRRSLLRAGAATLARLRKVLASRWLLLAVAACLLLVGLRQLDTYRHNAAFSDRFPCLTGRYVPRAEREDAAADFEPNAYDRRIPLHEDWANNFSSMGLAISTQESILPGSDPIPVTLSQPLGFYEKTWWGYRLAVWYPAGTTVDLGPRSLIGWAVLTSYPTYTRGWRNMYRIPTAEETEHYKSWDEENWLSPLEYASSMRYYVRTSDLEPLLLQFFEANPEFWREDLAFPYVTIRPGDPQADPDGVFRSEYAALSMEDLTDEQIRNLLLYHMDLSFWLLGTYRSPDMLDSYLQPPDAALLCAGGLLLAAHLTARRLARRAAK